MFRFALRAYFSRQKRTILLRATTVFVTNGTFKRADLFIITCGPSLFMVYADRSNSLGLVIHHDPEWTFYGHSHFARGPFSPLADLSFHKRTFYASSADRFLPHADL